MFALLLLAWLPLQTAPTNSQAAGLQALDAHDYERAKQVFSKLAADDPKDYSALFNLALAESALKEDQDSIAHYKQVLGLKPGLYEAELNLGILDIRDQHASDAVPLLRDAAKQRPAQARAQRYLGEALLLTGDTASAAGAFQAALAADPKLAVAELGLGQSLVRQGKLDEGLAHYQQAAALDANLKSYLLEVAEAFAKAGRPNDAIPLLSEFPNDMGAREELGRLYLTENRPAEAVKEFEAAVAAAPTPANRLALATAYLKNNQPDLASPTCDRVRGSRERAQDVDGDDRATHAAQLPAGDEPRVAHGVAAARGSSSLSSGSFGMRPPERTASTAAPTAAPSASAVPKRSTS